LTKERRVRGGGGGEARGEDEGEDEGESGGMTVDEGGEVEVEGVQVVEVKEGC